MSWKKKPKGQYRSKFEATIANNLKERKIKSKYEVLKIEYVQPAVAKYYLPDWILSNGIIIEAKGITIIKFLSGIWPTIILHSTYLGRFFVFLLLIFSISKLSFNYRICHSPNSSYYRHYLASGTCRIDILTQDLRTF